MKSWSVVCTLAALAVSSVQAAPAVEACDLIKIFSIVKPLETNEDVKKCVAATGFELLPPPSAPTKEQIAKLCGHDSCKAVFTTLQKMDIPDCTISILGGVNMKKIINEAFGQCSNSAGTANKASTAPAPAPAPASATPSVTPTVTPAVTPAPASGATPAPANGATPAPAKGATPAPTPAPAAGGAKPPTAPAPTPTPASSTNKATGKIKNCHA